MCVAVLRLSSAAGRSHRLQARHPGHRPQAVRVIHSVLRCRKRCWRRIAAAVMPAEGPIHIAQEPDGSIRTRSAGSFRLPERPDRRRSAGIPGRRAEQPGRRSNQL